MGSTELIVVEDSVNWRATCAIEQLLYKVSRSQLLNSDYIIQLSLNLSFFKN